MRRVLMMCMLAACGPCIAQECDTITFTLTSDLSNGGPSEIEWEIEDQLADLPVSAGIFVFDQDNPTLTWQECLVQGCYRLRIESDDDFAAGSILITITEDEGIIIDPYEPVEWDDDRVDYVFGVDGGCSGVADCMATFTWQQGSIPGEIIVDNNSLFETTGSFTWSWNNGENSFEENPVIQFDENGIYELCLTLTAECVSTICQQVVVNNFPAECPDSLAAAVVECGTWIFVAGTDESATITWDFGDGTIIEGGNTITHDFESEGNYEVCATYLSDECGSILLCATVEVIDCGNNTGCPGELEAELIDCGLFEFVVENATGGNVDWNFGDGTAVSGNVVAVYEYTTPGNYIACAYYIGPLCESGIELCVPLTVEDCGGSDCSIGLEANTADGQTFTFEATSTVDLENLLWDFGDGNTQVGGAAQNYTFSENGVYLVCVEYEADVVCPDGASACVTVTVTGGTTSIIEFENELPMYPNPANDVLYLNNNDGAVRVEIRDLSGRVVVQSTNASGLLDISNLESGMYIITVGSVSQMIEVVK